MKKGQSELLFTSIVVGIIALIFLVVSIAISTGHFRSFSAFLEKSSHSDEYCSDIRDSLEANKNNKFNYEFILIDDGKTGTCLKVAKSNRENPIVCKDDKCKSDENYYVYQTKDYQDTDNLFCCIYTSGKKSETTDIKTESEKTEKSSLIVCENLMKLKSGEKCTCKNGKKSYTCNEKSCENSKLVTFCE